MIAVVAPAGKSAFSMAFENPSYTSGERKGRDQVSVSVANFNIMAFPAGVTIDLIGAALFTRLVIWEEVLQEVGIRWEQIKCR